MEKLNIMKRNYGKLVDGRMVRVTSAGSMEEHLQRGEKLLLMAAPKGPPPAGTRWARDGWQETPTAFMSKWKAVPEQPGQPRTFSKLKLFAALSQAGLWDALKSWLAAQTYEGMNAWDAFTLANELAEDHPMFGQWFTAAKAALAVTDEQAEAILAASVASS